MNQFAHPPASALLLFKVPRKKRQVTRQKNTPEATMSEDSGQNEDSEQGNPPAESVRERREEIGSESDSDVPALSTAASDQDSDSEDSDDESDNEAILLHNESARRQTLRENKYFTRAPYSPDIFPPRTLPVKWSGGRVRGKKPVPRQQAAAARRLFFPSDDNGTDGQEGDGEEGSDYEPNYRHKKIPKNKRRGRNREYSTLHPETQVERLKTVEKFMNDDEDWQLDFARRVFR